MISAASTSSMLTVPPTGSTSSRASRPAAIAPSEAPAAIRPKRRWPVECRTASWRSSTPAPARSHRSSSPTRRTRPATTTRPNRDGHRLSVEREDVPEKDDVEAEEHQRGDGHAANAEACGDPRVDEARILKAPARPTHRRRPGRRRRIAAGTGRYGSARASRNAAATTAM